MNGYQCMNGYEIEKNINLTPIQEFYKDTNVFITGASGFLGRVLMEKLLRSCPNISTIYILVRDKKGRSMETRIDRILKNTLFDRLRKKCPNFSKKIVLISGDITKKDLGLSLQDRELLRHEINIIFHCAATVRFDEKLRTAALTNVRPVRDLLHLAHQMPELKSFIHVSTAYSNCIRKVIEEKFYPPSVDYKALICMLESLSEENMDKLEPMLLKEYPNTYTFTKNIAEDLVRQCGNDLPIGVVRPAIVVSTYQEPIRAWINNFSGPAAGMVAGGLGLLRILPINPENLSNPVPVDLCVNSMIAAAWDVSNQFSKTKIDGDNFQIPIFNFESNSTNPITWRHMLDSTLENGKTIPAINALWFPDLKYQTSDILFHILIIFYHWIPAILADGIALCFGKSPRLVDVQLKIYNNSSQLKFFTVGEWTYQSDNILNLTEKMADKDKKLFFCNLRKLDWEEYLWYYPRGIRTYLVRESFDNLQDARKKTRSGNQNRRSFFSVFKMKYPVNKARIIHTMSL